MEIGCEDRGGQKLKEGGVGNIWGLATLHKAWYVCCSNGKYKTALEKERSCMTKGEVITAKEKSV